MPKLCRPRDDTINPLSEDLCETEPELFVCTWILPDGGIASGPGRPGPNYLQIAATTTMDPEYHDTVRDIIYIYKYI